MKKIFKKIAGLLGMKALTKKEWEGIVEALKSGELFEAMYKKTLSAHLDYVKKKEKDVDRCDCDEALEKGQHRYWCLVCTTLDEAETFMSGYVFASESDARIFGEKAKTKAVLVSDYEVKSFLSSARVMCKNVNPKGPVCFYPYEEEHKKMEEAAEQGADAPCTGAEPGVEAPETVAEGKGTVLKNAGNGGRIE